MGANRGGAIALNGVPALVAAVSCRSRVDFGQSSYAGYVRQAFLDGPSVQVRWAKDPHRPTRQAGNSNFRPRPASTCPRSNTTVRRCYPCGQMSGCDSFTVNLVGDTYVVSLVAEIRVSENDHEAITTEQNWVGTAVFGSHRWPWLHRIIRTLFAAAAFIAMVVLVLGGPAKARGVGPALGIRWIAFLVAAGASLILLRMGRLPTVHPNPDKIIRRVPSTSPTAEEILDARLKVSLKYSSEVIDLFSRMLRSPSRYVTRAVENVEVRSGCLCVQVTMEFALHDEELVDIIRQSGRPVALLPLIKLSKATTLDNLDILDSDGRHISPLLQDELYGLLAIGIENLFRSAYINSADEGAMRALTPIEDSVLQSLIQVICNPERVDKKAISSTIMVLDSAGEDASDPINHAAATYLHDLCEFFGENYIIAVETELPPGNRLTMKYSRTVPLYEQTSVRRDRMRVRLGLSPQSFTLPLTLPFEAPSYHFSLAGVPGSFVASQTLLEAVSRNPIGPERFRHGAIQPFLSSKCESALPYTHFHTRGLQRFSPIDMWTRVEFDEVPPGALGGALVVSAASAILIWFFTLVQPGLRPGIAIASDLPALLLAVPAFVATWIGNSVDRVQRSSTSTYIGLGVSTVVSLGSALLYIANANHKSFFTIGNFAFYHGLIRLSNVDATWLLLALVASFMSAYLAETLRDKLRGYMRLLKNDNMFRSRH